MVRCPAHSSTPPRTRTALHTTQLRSLQAGLGHLTNRHDAPQAPRLAVLAVGRTTLGSSYGDSDEVTRSLRCRKWRIGLVVFATGPSFHAGLLTATFRPVTSHVVVHGLAVRSAGLW
jgi:hypothetical protein